MLPVAFIRENSKHRLDAFISSDTDTCRSQPPQQSRSRFTSEIASERFLKNA